jgi:dimethylargininase
MAEVFRFGRALARQPGDSAVDGLRAVDRGAPEMDRFRAEHTAYVAALEAAGVAVEVLPALAGFPDSVFMEDPALTFPEGAILLRPGAPTRLGEAAELAAELRSRFDRVLEMESGFAEGGDVLVTPRAVMIGLSARTDARGAGALAALLTELGRKAEIVTPPPGVLHFKTACSLLDSETVLATDQLAGFFPGMRVVRVPEGEEAAANALRVNDVVLVGTGFPRTAETLDRLGYRVVPLDVAETSKLDAGLSCMSLRWNQPG